MLQYKNESERAAFSRVYTCSHARPVKNGNGDGLKVWTARLAGAVSRGLAVAMTAALVSGCGMSQLTSPFSSDEKRQTWEPSVTEASLLDAARSDTTGQVSMQTAATGCPAFDVWPRDRLLTIYEIGRVGDSSAIRHRGEITKTARECRFASDRVTVKYGFAGRVLLGPRGQPGKVSLPVKVHVTDRNRDILSTQEHRINVTIPQDDPVGYFSMVKEVTFPLPEGVPPSDYKLFIAFERSTPGAG